jgi:hypothetical protein
MLRRISKESDFGFKKYFIVLVNAERTRGNCIAVDVAAAEGRKCRDLLAESPDKGNAKNQTTPHTQI